MFGKRIPIALVLAAAAGVGLSASSALGARASHQVSWLLENTGLEFVTSSGSTQAFPGHLQTGDRILGRDAVIQGNRRVGYGNELCTVTYDANDLCQTIVVLPGKGQVAVSWLWIGRNSSLYGPLRFQGVIEGGTGAYARARGQFTAEALSTGNLRVTATLS
jgi:hypothetical protein